MKISGEEARENSYLVERHDNIFETQQSYLSFLLDQQEF